MRPICVEHAVEMPASKTGYLVQINDANGNPYQIWSGDRYTCPVGGESVVSGMGQIPVAEHFEPQFATWQSRVGTVVVSLPAAFYRAEVRHLEPPSRFAEEDTDAELCDRCGYADCRCDDEPDDSLDEWLADLKADR